MSTLPEVVAPGVVVTDGSLAHAKAPFQTIADGGTYRISLYLQVVFAVSGATGEVNASIYWIDGTGNERSLTSGNVSIPALGYAQMAVVARVNAGTALSYSTLVFNNAAGSRSWQVYITVEKLA